MTVWRLFIDESGTFETCENINTNNSPSQTGKKAPTNPSNPSNTPNISNTKYIQDTCVVAGFLVPEGVQDELHFDIPPYLPYPPHTGLIKDPLWHVLSLASLRKSRFLFDASKKKISYEQKQQQYDRIKQETIRTSTGQQKRDLERLFQSLEILDSELENADIHIPIQPNQKEKLQALQTHYQHMCEAKRPPPNSNWLRPETTKYHYTQKLEWITLKNDFDGWAKTSSLQPEYNFVRQFCQTLIDQKRDEFGDLLQKQARGFASIAAQNAQNQHKLYQTLLENVLKSVYYYILNHAQMTKSQDQIQLHIVVYNRNMIHPFLGVPTRMTVNLLDPIVKKIAALFEIAPNSPRWVDYSIKICQDPDLTLDMIGPEMGLIWADFLSNQIRAAHNRDLRLFFTHPEYVYTQHITV